jgi:hypothetical protein
MALTNTSLSGAITASATNVTLTAFTNPSTGAIGPQTVAVVDGEAMLVTDATYSPTLQVVRGYMGTLAIAHNTLAPVTYGLTSDYTQAIGTDLAATQYSIGVNNADVTLPAVDSTVYLTKAGTLAITINGPNKDQTNTIRFVSLTANAHTITYTAGFYANTTSSDVATFPATAGAVFTIVARNGLWNAVATADDGVLIG